MSKEYISLMGQVISHELWFAIETLRTKATVIEAIFILFSYSHSYWVKNTHLSSCQLSTRILFRIKMWRIIYLQIWQALKAKMRRKSENFMRERVSRKPLRSWKNQLMEEWKIKDYQYYECWSSIVWSVRFIFLR